MSLPTAATLLQNEGLTLTNMTPDQANKILIESVKSDLPAAYRVCRAFAEYIVEGLSIDVTLHVKNRLIECGFIEQVGSIEDKENDTDGVYVHFDNMSPIGLGIRRCMTDGIQLVLEEELGICFTLFHDGKIGTTINGERLIPEPVEIPFNAGHVVCQAFSEFMREEPDVDMVGFIKGHLIEAGFEEHIENVLRSEVVGDKYFVDIAPLSDLGLMVRELHAHDTRPVVEKRYGVPLRFYNCCRAGSGKGGKFFLPEAEDQIRTQVRAAAGGDMQAFQDC